MNVRDAIEQGSGGYGCKRKVADLLYAHVEGPCLTPISIEELLLKIGDFSTLKPRQVMARLELFQSPARFNNFFASLSNVCEINENGYVGGGFISASMIVSICLEGGMSKVQASRVDAIQVRIFIPSMGIFKGVLMKKEIVEGALIQLPQSMQKVLASKIQVTLRIKWQFWCVKMASIHLLDQPMNTSVEG